MGSLQMWINGAMTEWERKKKRKSPPPDMAAWNNQISTLKLFLQLIWDTDYNNISNIMVDERLEDLENRLLPRLSHRWPISDVRTRSTRFSRSFLASLENLDREELETTLSPWLNSKQIKTLWQRRDAHPRARRGTGGRVR